MKQCSILEDPATDTPAILMNHKEDESVEPDTNSAASSSEKEIATLKAPYLIATHHSEGV